MDKKTFIGKRVFRKDEYSVSLTLLKKWLTAMQVFLVDHFDDICIIIFKCLLLLHGH